MIPDLSEGASPLLLARVAFYAPVSGLFGLDSGYNVYILSFKVEGDSDT